MSFQEHGLLLYLSKDLYVAFIKLQADRGLGRSYAGLLPFVEGLYQLGYLSEEVYEEHVKRYSQPLNHARSEQQALAHKKEREEIERLEKFYLQVLQQWASLSNKARADHKKNAIRWVEKVKNAKFVLEQP